MYITLIILVLVVVVVHVTAVFSSESRGHFYRAGQCRFSDSLKLLTLTSCPPRAVCHEVTFKIEI